MYRSTAGALVVALALSLPCQYTEVRAEPAGAQLSGAIFSGDPRRPVVGAKLLVADPGGGPVYSSAPTGQDGRFAISDLPASTYELAIEAGGGLYPTRGPVKLSAGQRQEVQLALAAPGLAAGADPGAGSGSGQALPGAKAGVWSNPLTATLIVLGISVVVGVALESATDDDSSPFTP